MEYLDVKNYSQQKILNIVVTGLAKQGFKTCKDKHGNCRLHYTGLKCAMGQLIPDHEHREYLEELTPSELFDLCPMHDKDSKVLSLLYELRHAHDIMSTNLRAHLQSICKRFNLTWPKGV